MPALNLAICWNYLIITGRRPQIRPAGIHYSFGVLVEGSQSAGNLLARLLGIFRDYTPKLICLYFVLPRISSKPTYTHFHLPSRRYHHTQCMRTSSNPSTPFPPILETHYHIIYPPQSNITVGWGDGGLDVGWWVGGGGGVVGGGWWW